MTNSNLIGAVRRAVYGSLNVAKSRSVARQLRWAVNRALYGVVDRAVNRDVNWAEAQFWDPPHPKLARYLNEVPR